MAHYTEANHVFEQIEGKDDQERTHGSIGYRKITQLCDSVLTKKTGVDRTSLLRSND